MKRADFLNLAPALLIWAALWSVMAVMLPLFAVDETRYLTVAWEMRQNDHWLLPTLNHLPYSHKPPLLFWLINLMWTVFGVHIWPARVVQLLAATGALTATYIAARALFPKDKKIAAVAPLLQLACPPFMFYGSVIMFDMLMTVWVTLGIAVLWKLANEPSTKLWLKWGGLLGLGLITKGPVVLIYLAVPALAAPFWKEPASKAQWYRGILLGVLTGAAIVLCWAIPAAIVGGPEFAKMIFLKQSAGRMVNAFDHAEPAWFYIPMMAVFLLPFLFWPAAWRTIGKLKKAVGPEKLLICWIVSAFLIFSAMSGKQPHYFVPLTSGFALLAARLLANTESGKYDVFIRAMPWVLAAAGLAFAPFWLNTHVHDEISQVARDGVGRFSPAWFAIDAVIFAAIFWFLRRDIHRQALAPALCMALLLATFTVQAHKTIFPVLDLRPFAAALDTHHCKDKPLAFAGKYNGELGFLARMDKPFEIPETKKLAGWLKAHPGSCAVIRHKAAKNTGYKVLYSMPFREDQRYSLVK